MHENGRSWALIPSAGADQHTWVLCNLQKCFLGKKVTRWITQPCTSADSADDVVVSVQVQKSGDILPFGVQALAAEDVLEWLQPSGRRPEGCCCSTELSGGRGPAGCQRLYIGYRHRCTMHVPCMPTLTLADVCGRQPDSHQSFDPTSHGLQVFFLDFFSKNWARVIAS